MTCQCLNNIFGFWFNIPNFYCTISAACDEKILIKNWLEKYDFNFSFVRIGEIKMPFFMLFILSKFLFKLKWVLFGCIFFVWIEGLSHQRVHRREIQLICWMQIWWQWFYFFRFFYWFVYCSMFYRWYFERGVWRIEV